MPDQNQSLGENQSEVQFFGFRCAVEVNRYVANGQIALQLVAVDHPDNHAQECFPGEPIATATVCFPGTELEPDMAIIKNYSENIGILDALEAAGLVKFAGSFFQNDSGLPMVRLQESLLSRLPKTH